MWLRVVNTARLILLNFATAVIRGVIRRGNAVNVCTITERTNSFLPVFSLMRLRRLLIVQLEDTLKNIRIRICINNLVIGYIT